MAPQAAKSKSSSKSHSKSTHAASKSSRSKSSGTSRSSTSAIALLEKDHREVEKYFDKYEELEDDSEKAELARTICTALKVHTQIEEEIFYPQAREDTEDDDTLDEALVEHASAKELIAQIESMSVGDDLYDAKVKVLGEYVKHHVKEEENELFPEVEESEMDLDEIGKSLAARKQELMKQFESQADGKTASAKSK